MIFRFHKFAFLFGFFISFVLAYSQSIESEPIDWDAYDYVPGHQLLFYDDFTGDYPGEQPSAWNISAEGKVDILEFEKKRWLHCVEASTIDPAGLKLSEQFTLEMDFYLLKDGYSSRYRVDIIGEKDDDWLSLTIEPPSVFYSRSTGFTTEKFVELDSTGSQHLALQIGSSNFKCFINNRQVMTIPQTGDFKPKRAELFLPGADSENENDNDNKCMFTNFTIAQGPATMKDQLRISGKIVAYGIYFEPGKQILKPQSTPTIKELAELLQGNLSLNISIECHDNEKTETNENVKLSQARAEYIKDALVHKFQLPSNRISIKGWGETRPLGEPNTVDGRKMNQRVELIRK